jgi:predicted DNA-binding transcriptional regulator AlpA
MRSHDIDPDALLTEIHAADFLSMSVRTLQSWRGQGRGPAHVQAGRAIRYRRSDLIDWIRRNTVAHNAGAKEGCSV